MQDFILVEEVCGSLKLKNISIALRRVPDMYKRLIPTKNSRYEGKRGQRKMHNRWYVNTQGADILRNTSRKSNNRWILAKEAMIFYLLKQIDSHIKTQVFVDPYFIDFYLPSYNLYVEYYEKEHCRTVEYDIKREQELLKIGYTLFIIHEGEEVSKILKLEGYKTII